MMSCTQSERMVLGIAPDSVGTASCGVRGVGAHGGNACTRSRRRVINTVTELVGLLVGSRERRSWEAIFPSRDAKGLSLSFANLWSSHVLYLGSANTRSTMIPTPSSRENCVFLADSLGDLTASRHLVTLLQRGS